MRNTNPKYAYQIEYYLFRWLSRIVPALTHGNRQRFGKILGTLWYVLLPYRKGVARRNLQKAFPDQSSRWRSRALRHCFIQIAQVYLDIFAGYQLSDERFEKLIHPLDTRPLQRVLSQNRGVVLLGYHFGNWELVVDWLARKGYDVAAIAARMVNPLTDRLITDIRTRNGLNILPKGRRHTVKTFRYLKDRQILYMLADQNAGREGAWVRFFDQWSASFRGPALFALRKKCPILLTTALRDKKGRYTIRFKEFSPKLPGSPDEEHAIEALIQAYTAYFEDLIREHPEQYYWVHRRWKTRVPPEVMSGE